jgi:hypothetical protein
MHHKTYDFYLGGGAGMEKLIVVYTLQWLLTMVSYLQNVREQLNARDLSA